MEMAQRAAFASATSGKDFLRFMTCGSVDDGKSTLIGRLLHDSQLILEDQFEALVKESGRRGGTNGDIDFALLLDGLQAEREQGITIDVAYRFFATPRRSFVVADSPGHEQFTRNMATAASNTDLAVILIDARKGVLIQTRRHTFICSLLGIRHIIVAINKIDLIDFCQDRFERIADDYLSFCRRLEFSSITPIPISARFGDNIITRSKNTPWYHGRPLLQHLETIQVQADAAGAPFRFPVQLVSRPNQDFRGYAGTVASGLVSKGDPVVVASSGLSSQINEIVTYDGPIDEAGSGSAVILTLNDEIDVARGDILVAPDSRPEVSEQFAATVLWMDQAPLFPGRSYLIRIGTRTTSASFTAIKYKINVNTGEHLAAESLALNEIGFCNVSCSTPVAFDPYSENRKTGAFIVVDRFTNRTVGAGMVAFALRRGSNIHRQALLVGKADRAALNRQKPVVVWFTGLSGAGKSTIANIVEQKLNIAGYHTMMLDGDNIRHGLNRDLGFTEADRVENIRRVGEVAKLILESGLIVLCSFISPYRAEREMVRRLVADVEFIEVFVDTPLQDCMQRDPKGLYAKVKAGKIKNFTGVDAPYEAPDQPEIHLQTRDRSAEELADIVVSALCERKIVDSH